MANETRPFAVITGASMGIGFHLANVFAQHGYDLLITSGSEQIEEAAREFEASNVQVQSVQADLRTYEGVEKLWQGIQSTGRQVDAVALNAGVGVGGDFARETDLRQELDLIALNVTSTVHLAKLVLKDMVSRGQGALLFTSSIAGTMPAPLEAVFSATNQPPSGAGSGPKANS